MKKVLKPPATSPSSNIQDLLGKYDVEKEILQKQNKQLEQRIHEEIAQNHHLKELNNSLTEQLNKLKHEVASKERQLLLLESEHSNLLSNNHGYSQAQFQQVLQNYKQSLHKMKEDEIIIERLQQQLHNSKLSYDKLEKDFKQSLEDVEVGDQIKHLEDYIETMKKQTNQLKSVLETYVDDISILTDANSKLQSKYKDKKKKLKQLQGIVGEQEIKIKQRITEYDLEVERVKNELRKSKEEFDRVWKDLTLKNTSIELQKIQLSKQEQLLNQEKLDDQRQKEQREQREAELEIKCSTLTTQSLRLKDDIQRMTGQMIRNREQVKGITQSYDVAYKTLKEKMIKDIIEKRGDILPEEFILKIDRLIDQVRINSNKEGANIRLKERQKQLQNEIKHLKDNNKSKNNRSQSIKGNNEELIRLQNQLALKDAEIKLLENQTFEAKQSNESNLFKIIEHKKRVEQLQRKLQKEQSDNKKKQEVYTSQMKKCLNELYEYKDKLGSMKESGKEQNQLKQMMSSKITGYEKKIKQLLQSLDRKQDIIQGLKNNKRQSESLLQNLHERLNKAGQIDDVVRKLRQDLGRKDELMNSYKSKHDILKQQFQALKDTFEKLDKQAVHLDKQLQRKNVYINTMKDKYEKQMSQIQRKLKSNSDHTKSISNVMEHKLISIKKECLNYQQLIDDMKKYIWDVIQQLRQRQLQGEGKRNKSKKKKKQNKSSQQVLMNAKDWEATKVLGLKESELEEFINPKPQKINRKLYQQKESELQRIWMQGQILEYFQSAIGYMIEIMNL